MRRINQIVFLKKNILLCHNEERRTLNLKSIPENSCGKKILWRKKRNTPRLPHLQKFYVRILLEDDILVGKRQPFNYNVSPEFAYDHSISKVQFI
ncbi:MAG: hypothetical protein AAF600_09290 [Bacteroidota bacterium]